MGNTLDCFCEVGTCPSTRDLLNRYTRNGAKSPRTLIKINGVGGSSSLESVIEESVIESRKKRARMGYGKYGRISKV